MTYWIAWARDDAAFVVADSAVGRFGRVSPPERERSLFGELHVYDAEQNVRICEEGLKIAELGKTLFVFAGDVEVGGAMRHPEEEARGIGRAGGSTNGPDHGSSDGRPPTQEALP
jgi:hypothetical protein